MKNRAPIKMHLTKPFLSILLVLLMSALSSCRFKRPTTNASLPTDWYDIASTEDSETPSDVNRKTTDAIEETLSLHSKAIEEATQESSPEASPIEGLVPWRLCAVVSKLGLTASGIFGPLLFGGTAAVQTVWKPTSATGSQKNSRGNENSDRRPKVLVSGNPRTANLTQQVEPVIRGALSSKLIKNEAQFRKNVSYATERFRAIATSLYDINTSHAKWRPQKFRLEMGFDASGMVLPFATVGAAVSFRFDWDRTSQEGAEPQPATLAESGQAQEPADRLTRNLDHFVSAIGTDLDSILPSIENIEKSGFSLDVIRLGIAITGGFQIGLAQTTASVTGSIEFERETENLAETLAVNTSAALPTTDFRVDNEEPIYLIGQAPDQSALDLATRQGVEFEVDKSKSRFGRDRVLYKIKRSRLRRGLSKAVRMGTYFARRAANSKHGRWKVAELSTEFDASASGAFGLATASGQGIVELGFTNSQF